MSADVGPTEIIGLVEIIHRLNSPVNTPLLAQECHADIPTVQTMMETAKMLELIAVTNGSVTLTGSGKKFQEISEGKMSLIRDRLTEIEPFKTAKELVSTQEEVSLRQVADALNAKDLRWDYDEEKNEELLKRLLLDWAVYTGLLRYSGKTGRFRKA